MQRLCRPLRLVFLDDCSMLGLPHVAAISRRCQQARSRYDAVFGGMHVAFVGDLKQHEPVGGAPLHGGAAAEQRCDDMAPAPAAKPVRLGRPDPRTKFRPRPQGPL